jgi:hypothetical protein
MPVLSDIEINLVNRIAETQVLGEPLMATVRGASGSWRPALRVAMTRERMPAAFVSFIDETTSPDTAVSRLGPRFAVFVATRALRITSNPRLGDADTFGVYLVIEQLRGRLAGYSPVANHVAMGVHVRFLEADDRQVFYELMYRIAPVSPPLFAGDVLGGAESRTTRRVGPPDPQPFVRMIKQPGGTYQIFEWSPFPPPPPSEDTLVWEGEFRAESAEALDDLLAEVESYRSGATVGDLVEIEGPTWPDVKITERRNLGPRYADPITGQFVQSCRITFARAT